LKFKPLVIGKDNWTKEQLEHAEDIDFAAKYTPSYPNLMKYFLNGSLRHFFFDGAPGAGKSYESKIWCASNELPYIHVSCNASMGLDVLFGSERPRTDGKEGFTFVYGPLYYAIKFGMVVGMDEFTTLPVESQNLLLSICEGHTKQFTLQNGEIVPINPNFRIIATANIGMAGNNEISEALVDRFTCRAFDDLTKDQLIERMSSCELYDCNNRDLIEVVAEKLLLLKEYFRNNNFKTALSVRNAQNFIAALLSDQEAKDKSFNFNLFTSCFIDATKINGDAIEMSELQELRDMAAPYYDEIMDTLNVSEGEEETPTPVKLTAKFDLEDLDEQTDSFMSEEGIEIPEEEA
jgi:MoxR-like ATPase